MVVIIVNAKSAETELTNFVTTCAIVTADLVASTIADLEASVIANSEVLITEQTITDMVT